MTTSKEDDFNGGQPQWKTISMEDNIQEALQEADDINRRRSQCNTISMEDDLNGR